MVSVSDFILKDDDHNLKYLKETVLDNLFYDENFKTIRSKIISVKNKQELVSFSKKLEKLGILKFSLYQ